MLQRSIEATCFCQVTRQAAAVPVGLCLHDGGEIVAPALLHPSLMTEDMATQLDLAAASIPEPAERAELDGRELRSDVAAFKAVNKSASLSDFLLWRAESEGLSQQPFPEAWLSRVWNEVPAQAAAEQMRTLFQPEREAEMALHYLENIDGTQLLLQTFRVLLRDTLQEMHLVVRRTASTHLRMLLDRAISAVLAAFERTHQSTCQAGAANAEECDADAAALEEAEDFPCESTLQSALAAIEAFEAAEHLAASLRAKLPGKGVSLVDELLLDGEASVTTAELRNIVEILFARSRVLAQRQGREPLDGKNPFESLPLSKEFVLLLQPSANADCGVKRIYSEVREQHLRLAISRSWDIT